MGSAIARDVEGFDCEGSKFSDVTYGGNSIANMDCVVKSSNPRLKESLMKLRRKINHKIKASLVPRSRVTFMSEGAVDGAAHTRHQRLMATGLRLIRWGQINYITHPEPYKLVGHPSIF